MGYNTQTPYIASYVIVKNYDGKIAFVLRQNTSWLNGYYSLPAGKVEKQESYENAAIREAKEEIGIDVSLENLVHKLAVHRLSNESNNKMMEWIDMFFEATVFSGDVYNAEPKVHSEVRWFATNELPEKLTPPVREALIAIEQGKTYIEHGWNNIKRMS